MVKYSVFERRSLLFSFSCALCDVDEGRRCKYNFVTRPLVVCFTLGSIYLVFNVYLNWWHQKVDMLLHRGTVWGFSYSICPSSARTISPLFLFIYTVNETLLLHQSGVSADIFFGIGHISPLINLYLFLRVIIFNFVTCDLSYPVNKCIMKHTENIQQLSICPIDCPVLTL